MSPTAKKSNRARITCNVIALGVVSLFNDAASEMIYPLIPIFITFLGSTAVILGIMKFYLKLLTIGKDLQRLTVK